MIQPSVIRMSLLVVGLCLISARAPAAEATDHSTLAAPASAGEAPAPLAASRPAEARLRQVGVNFGLLQLALGGFNVAAEFRYRRLWLEYSHGMELSLNDVGGSGLSSAERRQDLHVYVPYTTGFGVGVTLVDELWLGVEFKDHRYEVNAPGGAAAAYNTYSIGPVLGYKLFVTRGLFVNGYLRYWPTVASSLEGGKVTLDGTNGPVVHEAHDWGVFANVSIGYAFDI
jgi:hypothetical protein